MDTKKHNTTSISTDLTENIDNTISYVSSNLDSVNISNMISSTDSEYMYDKISTSIMKAFEIQKFLDLIKPEEYMDLPKLISEISMDELMCRIVPDRNTIISKQTSALKSVINSIFQSLRTNVAKLVLTKQKLKKKDNRDKKKDDQDMKEKIHLLVPKYLPKVKQVLCMCIILVFLYLIFIFLYPVFLHKDQNHKDNTFAAVVELEKIIFNQGETIRVVNEYLHKDTPLFKVIALVGDTSVDKSYTVDIIKKKLRKTSENNSLFLHPNFIVLENLRAEHSTNVINFVKTYQKTHVNRRVFTILIVFQVEQIHDDSMHKINIKQTINRVKDAFSKANINIKIIPYEPLNEKTLEKYIINTMKNNRLTFSQDQIDIIKRHLIEDDTDCKRACT